MASSVHYKFKSQKEFVRVAFDGTGISVFELKREIISLSRLGDGSDFELAIHNAETGEGELPSVKAQRRYRDRKLEGMRTREGETDADQGLPCYQRGAARYVSGRMPVNAKSNSRIESAASAGNAASTPTTAARDLGSAQSEEDKIKALLNLQESQWKVQQEEMAKYVFASDVEKRAIGFKHALRTTIPPTMAITA
ncbi:hypothetical protein KEM52_001154 [Ascosphaera acerosa]|nr:hypothetical protein KEM52_001154 [Ascosphaera acerosa]